MNPNEHEQTPQQINELETRVMLTLQQAASQTSTTQSPITIEQIKTAENILSKNYSQEHYKILLTAYNESLQQKSDPVNSPKKPRIPYSLLNQYASNFFDPLQDKASEAVANGKKCFESDPNNPDSIAHFEMYFREALNCYLEIDKYKFYAKDSKAYGDNKSNIAWIYKVLLDYPNSLIYYEETYQIYSANSKYKKDARLAKKELDEIKHLLNNGNPSESNQNKEPTSSNTAVFSSHTPSSTSSTTPIKTSRKRKRHIDETNDVGDLESEDEDYTDKAKNNLSDENGESDMELTPKKRHPGRTKKRKLPTEQKTPFEEDIILYDQDETTGADGFMKKEYKVSNKKVATLQKEPSKVYSSAQKFSFYGKPDKPETTGGHSSTPTEIKQKAYTPDPIKTEIHALSKECIALENKSLGSNLTDDELYRQSAINHRLSFLYAKCHKIDHSNHLRDTMLKQHEDACLVTSKQNYNTTPFKH